MTFSRLAYKSVCYSTEETGSPPSTIDCQGGVGPLHDRMLMGLIYSGVFLHLLLPLPSPLLPLPFPSPPFLPHLSFFLRQGPATASSVLGLWVNITRHLLVWVYLFQLAYS